MSTKRHVQCDEKCPGVDKGLGVNAPTHDVYPAEECISWECEHYCCADQSAVHSNFGLGSCNHDWACALCDAHKRDFCCTDEKTLNSFKPRIIRDIEILAHRREGYCKGCKRWVLTKENIKREKEKATEEKRKPKPMCEIANPGDRTPKMPKGMAGSWLQNHMNVRYGTDVVIRLEPCKWAICTLHLHLRMCSAMLDRTVFRELSERDGKAGEDGKSVAQKLFEFLCLCGLRIGKVKPAKQSVDLYYHSLTKHSFCGSEADAICLLWREVLELVYPAESREKMRGVRIKYERAYKMWECYTERLWPLICKQGLDREDKADQVKNCAHEFTELFVSACGATEHLYIHMPNAHLPDQIRTFPVDITKFQTSGLEHGHKLRKQWASTMMSFMKGPADALKVVSSYVKFEGTENAYTVAGYVQKAGFSRIHQLLRSELMSTVLFKQLQNSDGHLQIAEDAKKNVRAQRRAREQLTCLKLGPMPPLKTC